MDCWMLRRTTCGAGRYERSGDRVDTRAGDYERKLHTKAGEVNLTVPKLRSLPFETQIIERYRRGEQRRGVSDRDVPGRYECSTGRRHHPGFMGRKGEPFDCQ